MKPDELRAWRERFGLTQQQAADRLPAGPNPDAARRTWQRWEAGENEPPLMLLRALRDLERELAEDWHGFG